MCGDIVSNNEEQSSYDHWVTASNRTGAYIASMRVFGDIVSNNEEQSPSSRTGAYIASMRVCGDIVSNNEEQSSYDHWVTPQ